MVFYAAAGQSSCDRDWFQGYGAPESSWPSSDSSWQCYYMLGTTTKLSMPSCSGVVVTLEIFSLIGLTVTEINIKKVQKL